MVTADQGNHCNPPRFDIDIGCPIGHPMSIATLRDSILTLGVRSDATTGYDPYYDTPRPPSPPGDYVEAYFPHSGGNWPTFFGKKFAADFTGPADPHWAFKVGCTLGSGLLVLAWDNSSISALPEAYHIFMRDSAAGININLRSQNFYSFQYSGTRGFSIWTEFDAVYIPVSPRWNIVSVPRITADSSKSVIFPTSTSEAFAYDGKYTSKNKLENGTGYWLKFGYQQSVLIAGTSLTHLSVPLATGWNLIGTIDRPVPAPSGGVLASEFFGYEGSYQRADTLKPGEGYWVKASFGGFLILDASQATEEKYVRFPDLQEISSFTITDEHNSREVLYLAERQSIPRNSACELPPLPPCGSFDARFSSQKYLEAYDAGAEITGFTVLLQAEYYPLKITADVKDPLVIMTISSTDDKSITDSKVLGRGSDIIVSNHTEKLSIKIIPKTKLIRAFKLEQNYPNPFNPSTLIGYQLPERAFIKIRITDVLGREISSIASGIQDAGYHAITIEGETLKLQSGVYFCTLEAMGIDTRLRYSDTKKIIYIK